MAEIKIIWSKGALKDIEEIINRNYRIVYKTSEGRTEIATIFQGSKQLE